MVPTDKNPRTLTPITSRRPLCNGPAGGWRTGRNPRAGGAQQCDIFNQVRNLPPRGSNLRPEGATRKP
jgi:hypothetical protein